MTIAVENGDQPSMMGYTLDLDDHSYNPNPVYRQRIKFWLQRAIEMGGTGIPPNGGKKTYAVYAQDNLSWLEEREQERSHRFHDPTGEEVIPGWPEVGPVETLQREVAAAAGDGDSARKIAEAFTAPDRQAFWYTIGAEDGDLRSMIELAKRLRSDPNPMIQARQNSGCKEWPAPVIGTWRTRRRNNMASPEIT
jgi:hypothetical protein